MAANDLTAQAICQSVEIVAYDPHWPARFEAERKMLSDLFPATFSAIEHIGSTAVAGLSAKPVIDLIAVVPSMSVADRVASRLTDFDYLFPEDFNAGLGERRWLMKHAQGRRTHHLHLVLPGSADLADRLRFRDLLRADSALAKGYVLLKNELAHAHSNDREAYTDAKAAFVKAALGKA